MPNISFGENTPTELKTKSFNLLSPEKIGHPTFSANARYWTSFRCSDKIFLACGRHSENSDSEYPQHIFEIGTVFSRDSETETGIKEIENLIVSLTPGNFTQIKQILDYLTRTLGINYTLESSIHSNLIDGRTASVKINNKKIGYLGEIHPQTLKDWSIKMPCAVLEISLEEIFKILEN